MRSLTTEVEKGSMSHMQIAMPPKQSSSSTEKPVLKGGALLVPKASATIRSTCMASSQSVGLWGMSGNGRWADKGKWSEPEPSEEPERRIHPRDPEKTPYTYAEFKKYAPKTADKMWKEAKKPVEDDGTAAGSWNASWDQGRGVPSRVPADGSSDKQTRACHPIYTCASSTVPAAAVIANSDNLKEIVNSADARTEAPSTGASPLDNIVFSDGGHL